MAPVTVTYNAVDSLSQLEESTKAAQAVVPDGASLAPPDNGISLLDVKNELFLAYLQNLALRNLAVIRSVKQYLPYNEDSAGRNTDHSELQDELVDELIRQRVYLERGVKPLEERLKYTIDKTLRAAEEQDRKEQQLEQAKSRKVDGAAAMASGSEESESDDDETNLRPNIAALGRQNPARDGEARSGSKDGVYRPPRVTATVMPEPGRGKAQRERPQRSRTMDEYVSSELAAGPVAEPSIGSMIAQGGRRQISAREREKEQERRDYEETHLTRLQESKKDKSQRRARDGGFGGEDWRGLGDGLDRIDSLTRGVKKTSKEGALERSRKRRATEDAPLQDGAGGLFDKRKKKIMRKFK